MKAAVWWVARGLFALAAVVSVTALLGSAADCNACQKRRAEMLSSTLGVRLNCNASTCQAKLSAADAHRLSEGQSEGAPFNCAGISNRPDIRSSSGAFTDPCCNAGGSACTSMYHYVVSESAGLLCLEL